MNGRARAGLLLGLLAVVALIAFGFSSSWLAISETPRPVGRLRPADLLEPGGANPPTTSVAVSVPDGPGGGTGPVTTIARTTNRSLVPTKPPETTNTGPTNTEPSRPDDGHHDDDDDDD